MFSLNRTPQSFFAPLVEELNSLTGIDGWFTSHYGGYDMNGSSVQEDNKKDRFKYIIQKELTPLETR